jgi:hypothetical protein
MSDETDGKQERGGMGRIESVENGLLREIIISRCQGRAHTLEKRRKLKKSALGDSLPSGRQ